MAIDITTQRKQLQTQLTELETSKTMELRKRDLPITKPSKAKLSYIGKRQAEVKEHLTDITEWEGKHHKLDTGEWIDKTNYNELSKDAKAYLNKYGLAKYNKDYVSPEQRLAIADGTKFKRENIQLDNKEWVNKEFYQALDKEGKAYINKHGVDAYNKHREAEFKKATVLLDTGEHVDKGFYNELDKDAKAYINKHGIAWFNDYWIPAHKWVAAELEKNYRQLPDGSWIKKTDWAKLDKKAKDYITKYGSDWYNKYYIPAQTWLAGFGSKPWLVAPPKPKPPKPPKPPVAPPEPTIAGITLPRELAWAGAALPVVSATPIPHDDIILYAGAGATLIGLAIAGKIKINWNDVVDAFKLDKVTMQDIIEGVPEERIKMQDIIEGLPTGKVTIKDITEGFPFTQTKVADIMTRFPLTQTQMADIAEGVPLVAQKIEDTMTVAVASAEAGRKVVQASGGFIDTPKVSSAMTGWQTALGRGVVRDIQEAMNNADRAVDTEYHRRVLALKGQEDIMTKAEYARQFSALEQSHLVWDRSIKVYNAKLNDFAVATDELVASISPEPIKIDELTTKQKLAISAYVASLLSKLYTLPKPVKEATAIQYITQNIVVPQTIPEIVHMAAAQAVIQARAQELTKPQIIAQAVPATQATIKTLAIPATVMPATRVTALVRPAVLEAVATSTRTLTRTFRIPPFYPFRIPLPDGTTLKLTKKQWEGIIAWKQGFMYKMIYSPYGKKNIVNSRKPLAGVKYFSGAGSAAKSIIAKGGVVPKVLLRDMGIMDIRFVTPKGGRKPKIHFKRDIKQRTTVTPEISTMR